MGDDPFGLHGPDPDHLYAGSYSRDSLVWWADRIREWTGQGREIYVYFNNDGHGNDRPRRRYAAAAAQPLTASRWQAWRRYSAPSIATR